MSQATWVPRLICESSDHIETNPLLPSPIRTADMALENSARPSCPMSEVVIGDPEYDGRVCLYIIKGTLLHPNIFLPSPSLIRPSGPNILHKLHQTANPSR